MQKFYDAFVEHFKEKPISILEIGSRDALHAEMLRKLADIFPRDVYIVEPHPESYRNIITNFPEFRAFELAISDRPGVVDFNAIPPALYNRHVVGTSSLLKVKEEIAHYYPAPTWIKVLAITGQTLLQLINRWQIDLVKIDVEGYTYEVLKSFGDDIRLLRALHVEVEVAPFQIWEGQHSYQDVRELMIAYGFKEAYYDGAYWSNQQGDNVWLRID